MLPPAKPELTRSDLFFCLLRLFIVKRFSHALIATIAAIHAATGEPDHDEVEAVDPGIDLPRQKGGGINFRIIHNRFEVLFFDEAKRLVAPCAKVVTVRFTDASNEARRYKMVREGEKLVSRRVVSSRPRGRISLSLLSESLESTRESFCFDYPAQR